MWTFHKLFCFLFVIFVEVSGGEVLLVSHNHGILLVDVDNRTTSNVLSADQPVVAFDVHRGWRQFFWATESTIYRTPVYDPTTTTPLAVVGRVGSLAVDWVHHLLYWTDVAVVDGGARVEVAHLDGRGRRVVHRLGGDTRLGAMVVDPLLGKLFWLEWDESHFNKPRIVTCNVDGSGKKTFYESELIARGSPLAIDVTYNSIYFYKTNVTSDGSELWDANYQILEESVKLFDQSGEPPSSLCLAKNGFYFSNKNGTYSIRWVKKTYTIVYEGRTDHIFSLDPYFKLVDSRLKNSKQIRVVSEVTQPQWPDQCAYHQCEHECVVTSHQHHQPDHQLGHQSNTSCVCRYGFVLKEDGRTCEERGFLIYSTGTTFGRYTPRWEDNTLLYTDSSANIQTFDVDVGSEYIYWSDLFAQTIYRAPIEQMSRKEVVAAGVTAYGIAVDWIHHTVYWSDQSRILVVRVEGGAPPEESGAPLVVLDGLDSPGNMAVDPLDKYIFWVECGSTLSILRAGLDGGDVTTVVASDVTCGMSLTVDHNTRSLYFLDWAGMVSQCRYDGSSRTRFDSDVVRGVAVLDHQPLWTATEDTSLQDLQPSMVKVVKRSHQPEGSDGCAEMECGGVCLPTDAEVPRCVCPEVDQRMAPCSKKKKKVKGKSPNDYLDVVEVTPFSATLRCSGPLMRHNMMRPWVRVDEVDSLVPRDAVVRGSRHVHVDNCSLPFTVDGLNPATTYNLTVQHGVTRGSRTIQLHTPPPPLAVRRLPLVTAPGIPGQIRWTLQGVHYDAANPWEQLVTRKYFLLLLSKSTHTQADPPPVPQDILHVLNHKIKMNFIVIASYLTEEDFDDDPEMYLANLLWGETFQLAMVQTTEYKGCYNLDLVYSKNFSLPDPYWRPFVEGLLQTQDVVDSIERL